MLLICENQKKPDRKTLTVIFERFFRCKLKRETEREHFFSVKFSFKRFFFVQKPTDNQRRRTHTVKNLDKTETTTTELDLSLTFSLCWQRSKYVTYLSLAACVGKGAFPERTVHLQHLGSLADLSVWLDASWTGGQL